MPSEPIRRQVKRMALLMEAILQKHDQDRGTRGWLEDTPTALLNRLHEEVAELTMAIKRQRENNKRSRALLAENICKEAVDVANFCMMIVDVVESEFSGE